MHVNISEKEGENTRKVDENLLVIISQYSNYLLLILCKFSADLYYD